MSLIERAMSFVQKFKRALTTKSTHLEVDERLDMATMRAQQAEYENRRMLSMLQETLDKLRVYSHGR